MTLAVVLFHLRAVLVSFLVAMALACVLNPLADRLSHRLGWPRGVTVSAVAVSLALVLGLLSYLTISVFSERVRLLAADTPAYVRALERALAVEPSGESAPREGISRQILLRIEKSLVDMLEQTAALLLGFASRLYHLVVIPILVFYMVRDAPLIGRKLYAILPARYREESAGLWAGCYRALYGYIYGQLALIVIAGALTTFGLAVLGVPHALVLGVASGIVEAVPYLGPITAGTLAALITLPQGVDLVLKVVFLYLLVRLLIDLVIGPRVLGQTLHLHPLTVLFALLVGGHLLGVVGFFAAPPLTAMAMPAVNRVFGRKQDDEHTASAAAQAQQFVV